MDALFLLPPPLADTDAGADADAAAAAAVVGQRSSDMNLAADDCGS